MHSGPAWDSGKSIPLRFRVPVIADDADRQRHLFTQEHGRVLACVPEPAYSHEQIVFALARMRVEQRRCPPVVDHRSQIRFHVMLGNLVEHPPGIRNYGGCVDYPASDNFPVPPHPRGVGRLLPAHCNPPAHHVAVRHHDTRNIAAQSTIVKLVEVKQVGAGLQDYFLQVRR